ncbi:MAG: metallopeptidase TldD-related protein [Planctomycetota bacterium]|jgi:predicted Zn-dependent protease
MPTRSVLALAATALGCLTLACSAPAQEAPPAKAATQDAPAKPAPKPEPPKPKPDLLLDALAAELGRSMTDLADKGDHPLYFMAYRAVDSRAFSVSATGGAVMGKGGGHSRQADIEVRVGTPTLDNTHKLRDSWDWNFRQSAGLPVDDDPWAIRAELWMATDAAYKQAQERLTKVLTNKSVKVEEKDQSPDYTAAEPVTHLDPRREFTVDKEPLIERVRKLSERFERYPTLLGHSVSLQVELETRYYVSSEGHRIRQVRPHARISMDAWTKADDGMNLSLSDYFDVPDIAHLPSDDAVHAAMDLLATRLEQLRTAPLVEPIAAPAIIMNRAAGVFFHEIFGHRIEGHRQKDVDEGQTFTKKVGEAIMPEFIDIHSDPTQAKWEEIFLNGAYGIDDEGVRAQRVPLVEKGVLKGFLMSRSPIDGFPASNGHGRCVVGSAVVSRQSNLVVDSHNTVPFAKLREMLIAEVKKADKPYGLIFHDISGGFTTTQRSGPQSFKVMPLFVVRVYPDGREDEVVRGVDIVGTPLTSLKSIIATGDDTAVFNGMCGAESGWLPVSAVAPSMLVTEIEIEKKSAAQDRPPLLPAPAPSAKSNDLFDILKTEIDRTTSQLKMDEFEPPYYMAARVTEGDWFSVAASFGASFGKRGGPWRRFGQELRVGDYVLDNTNFWGGFGGGGGGGVPMENDELAIRRSMWLSADRAYKAGLEALARKKATLQTMNIPDRPDDLQQVEPRVHTEEVPALAVDKQKWGALVRKVSLVFRDYPQIQDSSVRFSCGTSGQHYLNNEGIRFTRGNAGASVQVYARTQSPDGMNLDESKQFQGRTPADLPDEAALIAAAHAVAKRLVAQIESPKAEEYIGPVLLEGEAVADFIMQLLIQNLSDPREGLQGGGGTVFKNRLKRRVTSKMLTVVDDPGLTEWKGAPLLGTLTVDDDGMEPQKLTLVQKGILRTWYMSRVPTKKIKETNGHSHGGTGGPTNVIVTSSAVRPRAELDAELMELAKDQELEYAIVIRAMESVYGGELTCEKVFADGRREPVRGASLTEVTLRALRDVLAVAEGEIVTHRSGGGGTVSVVHPSAFLIEELEIKQPEDQQEKLPLIGHPYHSRTK